MNTDYIRYRTLDANADLSRKFVKRLWTCEANQNDGDHFIFRTYASQYPTLIFCRQGYVRPVNDEVKGSVLLLGQSNKWWRFRTSNDFRMLCLTLYPSTLPLMFKIPANVITNRVYDCTSLSDELARFCQEIVDHGCDLECINEILLERLPGTGGDIGRIPSLVISSCQSTAREMYRESAKEVFMSQRNFERKFKHYSGFTPKAFSNLARFAGAIKSMCSRNKRLSDTALDHDYFDQAHFSNEFKRYTGFRPSVFVKRGDEENIVWRNFVDFFQALSICPPVLCTTNKQ